MDYSKIMLDPLFMLHNTHLEFPSLFAKRDPQLRVLALQKYQYVPPLLAELPAHIPGVYTVTGGRQIGKTTLMKPKDKRRYLIIDEVTYIRQWDMGVKFLADGGLLENIVLIITGSDSIIIQEARVRFPGRRGRADQVDFHIFPLSFYEFLKLTKPSLD